MRAGLGGTATTLLALATLSLTGDEQQQQPQQQQQQQQYRAAREAGDSQCGPHSYACAGTPRCVLSSQVT